MATGHDPRWILSHASKWRRTIGIAPGAFAPSLQRLPDDFFMTLNPGAYWIPVGFSFDQRSNTTTVPSG